MLAEEAWNVVLDDEEAKEAPCVSCKGRGVVGRSDDDCPDCGGFGVRF